MAAVIAVSCIGDIAPAVTDAGGKHTGQAADQILHAPEAAAGEHGAFV